MYSISLVTHLIRSPPLLRRRMTQIPQQGSSLLSFVSEGAAKQGLRFKTAGARRGVTCAVAIALSE